MEELWKDVQGYEGYYQVSNLGRIKGLDRKVTHSRSDGTKMQVRLKGRILKQYASNGYLRVRLSKDGAIKNYMAHRLVAAEFNGNSKNKPYVNHKNGIKHDNRSCNLEWCTASENNFHAVAMGLAKRGEDVPNSKFTNLEVLDICDLLDKNSLTHKEIGKLYGVLESVINLINKGHNWNWLTSRRELNLPKREGKNHHAATRVTNCRGEVFDTISEAADHYGMGMSHIGGVCNGLRNHSGKYENGDKIKWKYTDK